MANFPTAVPSYTATAGTDTLNATGGSGISGLLNNFEIDVTALATKMGTGSSTPSAGKVLRASGTGTSSWAAVTLTSEVTGTLPVANGGTGNASLTAYGVLLAGTTSTGALQQVSGTGTSSQVLTSNGAGLSPTWQTIAGTGDMTKAVYDGANVAEQLVGLTATQTQTNKRITPRVGTVADAATVTPTGDSSDMYTITAIAQAFTIAAPSGTPTDGQKLLIRIKDNGTGRAITWNAIYRVIGITLPTTTVATKTHYVFCVYNSAATKWDVLAVGAEA